MTTFETTRLASKNLDRTAAQAEGELPEEVLEQVSGGTPSIPIPPPRPVRFRPLDW